MQSRGDGFACLLGRPAAGERLSLAQRPSATNHSQR
jgi:hypothetical protein